MNRIARNLGITAILIAAASSPTNAAPNSPRCPELVGKAVVHLDSQLRDKGTAQLKLPEGIDLTCLIKGLKEKGYYSKDGVNFQKAYPGNSNEGYQPENW